jgi:shikimate dehydrogenase
MAFPSKAVAVDLVYRPLHTPFMRAAEQAGARAIGGLGLLVHQGAAALELWSGRTAPAKIMFEVAHAALSDFR